MARRTIVGAFIFCVLLLFLWWPKPSAGQVLENSWSEPYRLSGREASSSEPYILSDQFGLVHVFWVETSPADERATIFYTNFDGTVWASPVDLYSTAPGRDILYATITVDAKGILHLAWTEGETGPVYYTNAPAYNALSVRNWQPPLRLDIPTFICELRVDSAGTIHVLYAQQTNAGTGLFYKRSEDKGVSWLDIRRLDPDAPSNLSPNVINFVLDENEDLHATWTYIDLNIAVGAAGTWLRYAHSFDGGQTWSFPISIDESDESPEELRMAFPATVVYSDTVNIVWAGDDAVHREYRFSTDGGETWGATERIFGHLQGQARGDGLAVDSAGRAHFIGNIRWPMGLYHAYWDGENWSEQTLVYLIRASSAEDIGDRIAAHDIRLVVRAGNQLVAVFGDTPGAPQRGLYAMQHTLADVAALPVEAIPTATPTATPEPTPTSPPATVVPTLPSFQDNTQPGTVDTSPGGSILLGVVPILLLLGIVFVVRLALLRR